LIRNIALMAKIRHISGQFVAAAGRAQSENHPDNFVARHTGIRPRQISVEFYDNINITPAQ
jgi:hypothetical protein